MNFRINGFIISKKPWGKEILIEHTKKYAFKEIYMIKGTRSSLQSHSKKLETIFVESGKIELETISENGTSNFEIYVDNDAYTIPTNVMHRVQVLEDCRLFEVSTPELEDVVRYKDDFNRT